jgi:hypothetical protein
MQPSKSSEPKNAPHQTLKSMSKALYLAQLQSTNDNPRDNEQRRASKHNNTTEDLQPCIRARQNIRYQGTANRCTRESSEGNNREAGTIADTDLTQIRNLGDESGSERDKSARAEAVQGAEDDGGGVAARGHPEG